MVLSDKVVVELNGLSDGLIVLFFERKLHSVWELYWVLRWGFNKPCYIGQSIGQKPRDDSSVNESMLSVQTCSTIGENYQLNSLVIPSVVSIIEQKLSSA